MDRKKIVKEYKQAPPPMGILLVRNLASGKVFIESAMNVQGQLNSCKFQLKMGSHTNRALQADYNELGEERFSFEVADSLTPTDAKGNAVEDLLVLEKLWLEKLQPYDERGYNRRKPQR